MPTHLHLYGSGLYEIISNKGFAADPRKQF